MARVSVTGGRDRRRTGSGDIKSVSDGSYSRMAWKLRFERGTGAAKRIAISLLSWSLSSSAVDCSSRFGTMEVGGEGCSSTEVVVTVVTPSLVTSVTGDRKMILGVMVDLCLGNCTLYDSQRYLSGAGKKSVRVMSTYLSVFSREIVTLFGG